MVAMTCCHSDYFHSFTSATERFVHLKPILQKVRQAHTYIRETFELLLLLLLLPYHTDHSNLSYESQCVVCL